jgi:methionyl aminopeptidase
VIVIKGPEEIEGMRRAGAIANQVLHEVCDFVEPGKTTLEIDEFAAERIAHYGAVSAFYGYQVGRLKYPRYACISVNDEVVHGMGSSSRTLEMGDIVSVDIGVEYEGFIGDNALTTPVGVISQEDQKLLDVTRLSLEKGIEQVKCGNRVSDISRAVQMVVEKNGFSVVREFVGHGVGREMHEEPQIPNFCDPSMVRRSPELKPGMIFAIEPMVNSGSPAVKTLSDRWTVVTRDGKRSAHFEHTVLVTEAGPEIMTQRENLALVQK